MVRLHSSRARELPAPRPILRVLALGVNQRCQVRAAAQGSAPGLVAAPEDAGIAVAVAAGELLEGAVWARRQPARSSTPASFEPAHIVARLPLSADVGRARTAVPYTACEPADHSLRARTSAGPKAAMDPSQKWTTPSR